MEGWGVEEWRWRWQQCYAGVWGLIWEFCQYNCVLALILSCIRASFGDSCRPLIYCHSLPIQTQSNLLRLARHRQRRAGYSHDKGGFRGGLYFLMCEGLFFLIWNEQFAWHAYLAFISGLSYCEGSYRERREYRQARERKQAVRGVGSHAGKKGRWTARGRQKRRRKPALGEGVHAEMRVGNFR